MSKQDNMAIKLRVTEAMAKDVGRNIVRLDPQYFQQLQLQVADIVEITGKRVTICKAMPTYKEQRGQARIQMDGITRENASVGLDEFILVRKVFCQAAERIVL
ncbi:MAG: transitional endoplasmic reticulum ATPase, partial [bacterium]